MMVGVTGFQGNGKTALLCWLAIHFYSQGYKIYANFHILGIDYTYVNSIEDMEKIHGGYVFLDEFWTWVDSRLAAHSDLNRVITNIIMKARKRKYTLVWEAKFSHTIDRRIREHTDYFYRPLIYLEVDGSLERIQQSFLNPIKTEELLNRMWVLAEKCILMAGDHEEYWKVNDDDEDIRFRILDVADKYDTEEEIAMIKGKESKLEQGKKVENELAEVMRKVFPESEIIVSHNSGQYSDGLDVSMKISGKCFIFDSCYLEKVKIGSPRLDFRRKDFKEKLKTYKHSGDIPYIVYFHDGEYWTVQLTPALAKRKKVSISTLHNVKTLIQFREGLGVGDIHPHPRDINEVTQSDLILSMVNTGNAGNANVLMSISEVL